MTTKIQSGSNNLESPFITKTEPAEKHPYADLIKCDTNNETKFYPWEKSEDENWDWGETWENPDAFRFSSKEKMWKYLEELHRGIRNGKRTNKPYFTHADNVDMVENIAYQMGLTKDEMSRAKTAFFTVHPDPIRGERKDVTAVAVCAFIGEKARGSFHPQKLDEQGRVLAEGYAKMFACDARDVVKRYGKVQHHLRNSIPRPSGVNLEKTVDVYEDNSFPEDWEYDDGYEGEGGILRLDHSPS